MLRVVVGHSIDPDSAAAAAELIAACRRQLGDLPARGGLLHAAIDHDHAGLLAAIADAFPGLALVGCTTDGELSSETGFSEGAVNLVLFAGEDIEAAVGLGRGLSHDPVAAAQQAADEARAALAGPPALCVLTPDSLTASATALLAGLHAALGPGVPIVGGTAADDWRFQQTAQFRGREVVRDALPILLLGGALQVSHAVASGWQPVGPAARAHVVDGNIIQRIGDQTALAFYQHYLGDHITPSGEYPLAVHDPAGGVYLRAPLGYDAEAGSIRLAGEVPEGAPVQLTTATRSDIIAASRHAVAEARRGYIGAPAAALVFSCAARKQLLGTRTQEECALVRAELGPDVPVAGFYAYGEFAPLGPARAPRFHNETIVVLLLGDAAAGAA